MEYPNNFDTSAFPAGRELSLARFAAIFSMVVLFLVCCFCGGVALLQRYRGVSPLIIYVDAPNGNWELIAPKKQESQIPYYVAIQKSLVGTITEKWLRIAGDASQNAKMWTDCNRELVCNKRVTSNLQMTQGCDIFCLTADSLFNYFKEEIVPNYTQREANGETWFVIPNTVKISALGEPTKNGGNWRVDATVISNKSGQMDVVAYIHVSHQNTLYQQNLGYYITDFNAYKIN